MGRTLAAGRLFPDRRKHLPSLQKKIPEGCQTCFTTKKLPKKETLFGEQKEPVYHGGKSRTAVEEKGQEDGTTCALSMGFLLLAQGIPSLRCPGVSGSAWPYCPSCSASSLR